jgi:hypothetical protein
VPHGGDADVAEIVGGQLRQNLRELPDAAAQRLVVELIS